MKEILLYCHAMDGIQTHACKETWVWRGPLGTFLYIPIIGVTSSFQVVLSVRDIILFI